MKPVKSTLRVFKGRYIATISWPTNGSKLGTHVRHDGRSLRISIKKSPLLVGAFQVRYPTTRSIGCWFEGDVLPVMSALALSACGIMSRQLPSAFSVKGTPVQLLKEGEGVGGVIAVRRVNELEYYSLGAADLAKKVGLTIPKLRAVIDCLKLQDNEDFFKNIQIGRSSYQRYSARAISAIKEYLMNKSIDEIWEEQKNRKAGK